LAALDGRGRRAHPRAGEAKSDAILTAAELAERWQVKVGWVYAQTRAGAIPRVPLPGRYYRYRLDVIEKFERGELDDDEEAAA
jgi:hypothetical protein